MLPPSVVARVAVEQVKTMGWDRYVGSGGAVIGMHTFSTRAAQGPTRHVRVHA